MPIEHPFLFSSEDALTETMEKAIAPFWASRQQGEFVGNDGLRLNWCAFTKPEHTRAVVVVNGRIEGVAKYQEVFFDLFIKGYDVYSYDHRGQGHSQRLVSGSDIGHVVEFDDYVDDLTTFIDTVVTQKTHQQRVILAHSMGGAISTLYAARNPAAIDAIALSAPMLGINLSPMLQVAAKPLCKLLAKLQHPAGFAPGQVPYWAKPFKHNLLSQSEARYQWFRELYENDETLKVGGPSAQWIWQSIEACERAVTAAATITMPILLMQAARDEIVSTDAMFRFHRERQLAGLPIQFDIIADSRHELLFEKDVIRNQALSLALNFFDSLAEQDAELEQTA
ncbi:alpha/beta fold hydrolase [Enterovibrio paralichthyis]|uniref:alpha/beta fold hydrolase n=1 Tax=Enterovibrio paralichthyis TaxID=2853805 RepID=UPI001C4808AF|nr:alpha/beta fold hydrolase [Enterovibrio paralichthyis]MBV7300958.1 alpha/beta fold hydrolase [Enterovibrio paralichthyis]